MKIPELNQNPNFSKYIPHFALAVAIANIVTAGFLAAHGHPGLSLINSFAAIGIGCLLAHKAK